MKRIIPLILILTIFLSGCNNQEVNVGTEATISPTIPEETIAEMEPTTPTYQQLPMAAISLPATVEEFFADDGALLSRYTHQNIFLFLQDQEIADRIIIDFLNRLDRFYDSAEILYSQAREDYAPDNWIPYFSEIYYVPMRLDSTVLSLFGLNTIYSGGNYPNFESSAANYNMVTGDVLTLGSILENADSHSSLCDAVIESATAQLDYLSLFDDYEEIIRQRFRRDASFDEDWYFTASGIVFFFQPYEIAPYRSGVITIEVPYSKLSGILSDEFFPGEEDQFDGTMNVSWLSDISLESYTQISETILDPDGERIFLSSNGLLRDITVEVGSWDTNTMSFHSNYTAFVCAALSPGDGIMMQLEIPVESPVIQIKYRTSADIFTTYVLKNTQDNSITLWNPQ